MSLIDTHVHVGDIFPPLDAYQEMMSHARVDRAVLVQNVGNTNNDYLADCVRRGCGRFAAVAMVDLDDPTAPAQIEALGGAGFAGVRLWASTRSAGPNPYEVWQAIADNGLVASVRGPFDEVADPAFADLLRAVPGLRVRLEHVGFFRFGRDQHLERLLALADLGDVWLTWSGFYANSRQPAPYVDADDCLRATLEAFGPERILWSGDWNLSPQRPASLAEYAASIDHVRDLAFVTDKDATMILHDNAAALFRWAQP